MQGFDLNSFLATAQPNQQQQAQQPVFQQQQYNQYAGQPQQQVQQQAQWQGAPMGTVQQQGFGGFPAQQYQQPVQQQQTGFNQLLMSQNATMGLGSTPAISMQQAFPPHQGVPAQQFQGNPMQQFPVTQIAAPAPVQMPQQKPAPAAIFFSEEWNEKWGWMSNFFPAPFSGTRGNCKYITVEQYYMEKKARCADDEEVRKMIMAVTWNVTNAAGQIDWQTNNQANQYLKQLGQKIRTWDVNKKAEWEKVKTSVMRTALLYKFSQNQQLHDLLLATNDDVIFEASQDNVWGIGCTEQQARNGEVPIDEFGSNLVGFLLMEIRSTFRKTGKPAWALIQAEKPVVSMTRSEVSTAAPVNPTIATPIVVETPKPVEEVKVVVEVVPAVVETPKPVEEVKPVVEVTPVPAVVETPKPVEEVKPVVEVAPVQAPAVVEVVPAPAAVVEEVKAPVEVLNAPIAQPVAPVEIHAEAAAGGINPLNLL